MSSADHGLDAAPAAGTNDLNGLQRLLVAVDDSDAAGAAASFAFRLAGTAGTEVTLLHACPDLRSAEHAPPMADPTAFRAAAEHRLAETAEWRRRLLNLEEYAAPGARVRSWVVRGRAAAAVLEAATELDIDVILIGSRGLGSIAGRLLGSVSSHVVDHARCSVMVFPARREISPAHVASVIVGVDGAASSPAAVAAGTALATALGARLVLLAALEGAPTLASAALELHAEPRREAQSALSVARASVTADIEVVEELQQGPPRELLIAASERFGPSVLVVGAPELGGFASLLLGSTSRWILHHAPCPVLITRSRP